MESTTSLAPSRQRRTQSVPALRAAILSEHQRRQLAAWLLRTTTGGLSAAARRSTRELTPDSQASRSTPISNLSEDGMPANPCPSVGPYGTQLPMEQRATSRTDSDVTVRAGRVFQLRFGWSGSVLSRLLRWRKPWTDSALRASPLGPVSTLPSIKTLSPTSIPLYRRVPCPAAESQ